MRAYLVVAALAAIAAVPLGAGADQLIAWPAPSPSPLPVMIDLHAASPSLDPLLLDGIGAPGIDGSAKLGRLAISFANFNATSDETDRRLGGFRSALAIAGGSLGFGVVDGSESGRSNWNGEAYDVSFTRDTAQGISYGVRYGLADYRDGLYAPLLAGHALTAYTRFAIGKTKWSFDDVRADAQFTTPGSPVAPDRDHRVLTGVAPIGAVNANLVVDSADTGLPGSSALPTHAVTTSLALVAPVHKTDSVNVTVSSSLTHSADSASAISYATASATPAPVAATPYNAQAVDVSYTFKRGHTGLGLTTGVGVNIATDGTLTHTQHDAISLSRDIVPGLTVATGFNVVGSYVADFTQTSVAQSTFGNIAYQSGPLMFSTAMNFARTRGSFIGLSQDQSLTMIYNIGFRPKTIPFTFNASLINDGIHAPAPSVSLNLTQKF